MNMTARTAGLGIVGAAIVAALIYVSFRTDPVPVDLHVVDRGPLQVTIDADGKTQIRDIYEVAAPISGTALRSPVEVGDRVTAEGTVVAHVEPETPSLLDVRTRTQAEASVREAEAALHVAETELTTAREDQILARSQYERTKALVDRGVVSLTNLEDITQRLADADATVEAAQAKIAMAAGSLERSRAALIEPDNQASANGVCCVDLMSPADGVVLSVVNISERPVVSGAPLVTIGDPTNLELVADLLSSDAVRLPEGARAMVERWGGDDVLEARLDRVEPAARTKISALGIEEQRVDAIFELITPLGERQGLGNGFAVFLRIVEWEAEDIIRVPLSAVFRDGEGWAVFVAEGQTAVLREVSLGRRNSRYAEVTGGLGEGDTVITHPGDDVADGVPIVDRRTL